MVVVNTGVQSGELPLTDTTVGSPHKSSSEEKSGGSPHAFLAMRYKSAGPIGCGRNNIRII